MSRRKFSVVLPFVASVWLALVVAAASASSTRGEPRSRAGAAAAGTDDTLIASLPSLLVAAGEMPGFAPLQPQTFTDPFAWKTSGGDKSHRAYHEAAVVKRAGFVAVAFKNLRTSTDPNDDALSSALLFRSEREAHRYLPVDIRNGIAFQRRFDPSFTVRRFKFRDLPGAVVWTATSPYTSNAAANVYFVSGRCLMFVGDSIDTGNPAAAPEAAAIAVGQRVAGRCR